MEKLKLRNQVENEAAFQQWLKRKRKDRSKDKQSSIERLTRNYSGKITPKLSANSKRGENMEERGNLMGARYLLYCNHSIAQGTVGVIHLKQNMQQIAINQATNRERGRKAATVQETHLERSSGLNQLSPKINPQI